MSIVLQVFVALTKVADLEDIIWLIVTGKSFFGFYGEFRFSDYLNLIISHSIFEHSFKFQDTWVSAK